MPLFKEQLLEIWERGHNQHPVDQALTILSYASPRKTRMELAELSIGRRDLLLLELREQIFGKILNCGGACPNCKEPVEISFTTKEIRTHSIVPEQHETELQCDDYRIGYRLPDSRDLAAIAGCANDETARRLLIERCLVKITKKEVPIASNELSEEAIRQSEQAIAEHDPQSEILLALSCPECGTEWQMLFDIVTFLWAEIAANAKRLLQEIHILATAYGWTETDILELSDARRYIYLEMANA